ASGSRPQQWTKKSTETCCHHRCRSVDCQQQSEDEGDAEKRVHLVLLAQLSFLFLDQAIEFVEQFSISFADRVDDTGQHWFNLGRAMTQQSTDNNFFNPAIEFLARHHRGVQERATVLAPLEQLLFEETIERGHQGCVSDLLVEGAI